MSDMERFTTVMLIVVAVFILGSILTIYRLWKKPDGYEDSSTQKAIAKDEEEINRILDAAWEETSKTVPSVDHELTHRFRKN